MSGITTIFSDVGGVILTNGWDRNSRRLGAEKFGLDWEEFQDRHDLAGQEFETGRITLDRYLARTIFYRPRSFTPEQFKEFIFAQSQPFPETLAIVDRIARSGRYLMSTLNNEELELNIHRIGAFELRKYFTLFISSCFIHMRKPDEEFYRAALRIVQRPGEECLFIDDRRLNVEAAATLGIRTIHYQNPEQLLRELECHGIELAP